MKKDNFVHLHVHNEFSLKDGFGRSKEIVKHVNKIGQKAIALTNHGNVSGLINHYLACKEAGIKPILGIEAYFVPKIVMQSRKRYHIVLLVKNNKGYRNLMRLVTESNKRGFFYVPRVDLEMLEKYHEGLILTTACGAGVLANLCARGKDILAMKVNRKFASIFKDDYYLEVMAHSMANQNTVNNDILTIAAKGGMSVILTADSHYIEKEDREIHKVFLRHLKKRQGFDFQGYHDAHISSTEEIYLLWKKNHSNLGDCRRYMLNTVKVANKCEVNLEFKDLFPKFKFSEDNYKLLKNIVSRKLKEEGKYNREYINRLKKELYVIKQKDFVDYFLICYDLMVFARKNDILTGFGRGSVGGSLVAYLLGITKVDPLIHNTLFERFLRLDKKEYPDIDMDFDSRKRDDIIQYLDKKFPNRTAQIINFNTWHIRNAVGELCKIYDYNEEVKEKICQRIKTFMVEEDGRANKETLLKDKQLKRLNNMNGFITKFCKIYNQVNHFGMHAGGIAITNKRIDNYVAIMKNRNRFITSYDMNNLKELKILKLDILGLDTLSSLSITEELTDAKFDEKILKNKKVMKGFKDLEVSSIFQFDTYGGRNILEKIKPTNFDEVVACLSMNRPAPLKLGAIDGYIQGKQGKVKKTNLLYKVAKDTYGQPIYQEQVMQICRKLAKMDWQRIDRLFKLLDSKKDPEYLDIKKEFIKDTVEYTSYNKEQAEELFDAMTLYLFNKAHGVAYTLISFYCMYLYKYYPLEYIFSLLYTQGNERKLKEFETLASGNDILILLPHVNATPYYAIVEAEGRKMIQRGLTSIKGIGGRIAEEICSKAPYDNEFLVQQRIPKRILTSRVFDILLQEGAMEFDDNKYFSRIKAYNKYLRADFNRRYGEING